MNKEEIEKKVFEIVSKTSKKPVEELNENNTFEELKLDSLDTVDIMMNLSDTFGKDIPDEEAKHFKNLKDITHYIQNNL